MFTCPSAAGWRLEGAALALKSPQQMSAYRGLFAGKVEERKERLQGARLPGGCGGQGGWVATASRRGAHGQCSAVGRQACRGPLPPRCADPLHCTEPATLALHQC